LKRQAEALSYAFADQQEMTMTSSENKILIITGGRVDDAFLSERVLQEQYTMIIAADHGLAASDRLNLPLDFIVGDFDSVPEGLLKKYREVSTPIKTFPKEKDKTDTQIAIELALMHNAAAIDIIGATGSRLDHVLANIHLLMLPMQLRISACLLDKNNKIYLRSESFTIAKNGQFGDYVSLLPFTDQVKGLTLRGFKYPLNHIVLTSGSSLGISNEIKEEEARIEFTEGILLVIESRD
jgi:thiamine pyrophosphokinase